MATFDSLTSDATFKKKHLVFSYLCHEKPDRQYELKLCHISTPKCHFQSTKCPTFFYVLNLKR